MSFNLENIAILGASGAIGNAFTKCLSEKHPNASMFAFSRNSQPEKIRKFFAWGGREISP